MGTSRLGVMVVLTNYRVALGDMEVTPNLRRES